MNKLVVAAGAAALFSISAMAQTSTTSPLQAPQSGVDSNAPLPGANSFTENQVRERLTEKGVRQIADLQKGDDGIWRGTGWVGDRKVSLAFDYRGNLVLN